MVLLDQIPICLLIRGGLTLEDDMLAMFLRWLRRTWIVGTIGVVRIFPIQRGT